MLGARGPVGKRSDQRHGHRSKEELAADRAPAGAELEWYPEDPEWNKVAKWFYSACRGSGMSVFWEQTDVALIYYVAESMSRNLAAGKFNAMHYASVISSMSDLGITEGSRRRMKIELDRGIASDGESETDAAIAELLGEFA